MNLFYDICCFFMFEADVLKFKHLRTNSFVKHLVLGDLYDLFVENSDKLSEMCIGLKFINADQFPIEYKKYCLENDITQLGELDMVGDIMGKLLQFINSIKEQYNCPDIENVLISVLEEVTRNHYKLTRLN